MRLVFVEGMQDDEKNPMMLSRRLRQCNPFASQTQFKFRFHLDRGLLLLGLASFVNGFAYAARVLVIKGFFSATRKIETQANGSRFGSRHQLTARRDRAGSQPAFAAE